MPQGSGHCHRGQLNYALPIWKSWRAVKYYATWYNMVLQLFSIELNSFIEFYVRLFPSIIRIIVKMNMIVTQHIDSRLKFCIRCIQSAKTYGILCNKWIHIDSIIQTMHHLIYMDSLKIKMIITFYSFFKWTCEQGLILQLIIMY